MNCKVCKDKILPHEYDSLQAFQAISPVTFRKANFHSFCYGLELEEAEQTESKSIDYKNRLDEYLTKDLGSSH